MPTNIHIVRKPNGNLEPDTGVRNKLKKGDSVIFTAGDGAQDLVVEFTGASPFGNEAQHRRFPYGHEHTVQQDFDESPGAANVYVYVCHAAGGNPAPAPGDGGEIEVVRG